MDAFLAEINLAQHATILDKLGYDDPLGTWGVMSAPGDRWEVVMPQVRPTWGCEIFCEAPVSPHPPPCAG